MSFGLMLSNLIFGPLKLLFEVIYTLSSRVLSTGMSIIVLSLIVNILVLPLYKRADALQEEERQTEERLGPAVKHIKSAFRGDEQVMILQAFYRENRYSPFHALKGALPLLLQVPFFVAAYTFLSNLGALQGTSFGPIRDLGVPDAMLTLGGVTLNLLPILMTAVNLVSGAVYTRGAPLKSKLQLLGMALIFLVLLYDSPAGLTFYWTLNNVFSLGKNLVQKLLPHREHKPRPVPRLLRGEPRPGLFFLLALLLALLTGALIPSNLYAASTGEFILDSGDLHPLWHVVNALLLSSGTFLLWGGIYYALGTRPVRRGMEAGLWILFGLFLVNHFLFHSQLGTVTASLAYEDPPAFSMGQKLLNLALMPVLAAALLLLLVKKENLVRLIALTLALGMGGLSLRNVWIIRRDAETAYQALYRNYEGAAEIPLSKTGKNVVVLMLDRAISSFLPAILAEKPELRDAYSGFVYYPNTLSFGMHTNLAAPALFGGYDYTPTAINARPDVTLMEKNNEALMLLPTLFSREGYRLTLFDMPYPGDYTNIGDYALFDSLPDTNARIIHEITEGNGMWDRNEDLLQRNTFCFSLTLCTPTVLFGTLYNMGHFNQEEHTFSLFNVRERPPVYAENTASPTFMSHYDVLRRLKAMTRIQEEGDTLLVLVNYTTHTPTLLQAPDYVPVANPNNTAYNAAHPDRFLAGPHPMDVRTDSQWAHYDVDIAALSLVGDWLQDLKARGVYDNTRIIIAADHGFWLRLIPEGELAESGEDIMGYNPLLMFKDFGAEGSLKTDTAFMTNADVPTLATAGIMDHPVNPFTGHPVSSEAKANPQYVSISRAYEVTGGRGTVFEPSEWYSVSPEGDDLFDRARWTFLPEKK